MIKKTLIVMIVSISLFVGIISIACDNDSEKIQKANELISKGERKGFDYTYVYNHYILKGQVIYLKLIYEEEKKQTQMLQKIMNKLNIK